MTMSVFEDIKTGLHQAIVLEKARQEMQSHFEHAENDIQNGRVQPAEDAFSEVINNLEKQEGSS